MRHALTTLIRHLAPVMLPVMLFLIPAFAKTSVSNADRQKSGHLRLQAINLTATGNYDMAHELFKRAWTLDASNSSNSFYYAMGLLSIPSDSLSQFHQALEMMRPMIDEYPEDYDEARFYALTAAKLLKFDESNRVLLKLDSIYPRRTELLIALAENHAEMHEFDKAIAFYNRYEKAEGASSPLSLRKIKLHLAQSDTLGAIAEADDLIKANPMQAEYYILKGNVEDYLGRPDSAIVYYEKAEQVSPSNSHAKLALAGYYKEHGDSTGFDTKIYEALLCDDFQLSDKLELLAEYIQPLLNSQAKTDHADYLLSTLRNQYPHEPQILDFAARYAAAKGDWNNAAEQISYAIDQDPDNENFRAQRLTYIMADGRYDDVIKEYQNIVSRMRPTPIMQYFSASALVMLDHHNDAIAMIDSLIHNISPTLSISDSLDIDRLPDLTESQVSQLAGAYSLAGDTYSKVDLPKEAFKAYENSILLDPDNAATLNNYAFLLCEKSPEDIDKAFEMGKKAITAAPESPIYLDTFAWILFKKGEYKEALRYMQEAMKYADEEDDDDISYDMYEHYGDILFMCGQPAEALKQWEKALSLEPNREILKKKVKFKTYFYE